MKLADVGAVTLGAGAGTAIAQSVPKPHSRRAEHARNNLGMVVGLATIPAAAIAGKNLAGVYAAKNPTKMANIYTKTGEYVEKAIAFLKQQKPKVMNSKAINFVKTRLGGNWIAGKLKTLKANSKFLTKIAAKAKDGVKYFEGLKAPKKGKYALIAAGIALLAGQAVNIVRAHDKRSGAIDQKHDDMRRLYEMI